jgi:hypothetical protein
MCLKKRRYQARIWYVGFGMSNVFATGVQDNEKKELLHCAGSPEQFQFSIP